MPGSRAPDRHSNNESVNHGSMHQNRHFFQPKLTVNQPNDVFEQEADAMADQVMRPDGADKAFFKPADGGVQRKCQHCDEEEKQVRRKENSATDVQGNDNQLDSFVDSLGSRGQSLPEESRQYFEPRFGQDFSNVRIHSDSIAAKSAASINALAYTTGNNIVFNSGQYSPASEGGKRLMAHELTHVVQQSKGLQTKRIQRTPTPPALPTDLSGYPPADRQRLQVSTIRIDQSALPPLDSIFATTPAAGGGATTSIGANGTVVFNANVPATSTVPNFDVRRGLTSIAGQLENSTNTLPLNSTVTIVLDLTRYGGASGNYRFSYFQHGTGASISEVTLIEQLNTNTTVPTTSTPSATVAAGAFVVGGQNFTLASGWTQQQQAFLLQALNMLPAAALTQITGATFARGAAAGTEAGSYNDTTHTITIRDNAFTTGLNVYAGGNEAVRIILHEIGHALDYLPMRNAWTAYQGSGAAGPLTRARSLSGLKYALDPSTNNYQIEEGANSTDFRTAVTQDRTIRGEQLPDSITTYGATNWEENFAEAFALYMADRTLFQSLRPNTYAYFHRRYP